MKEERDEGVERASFDDRCDGLALHLEGLSAGFVYWEGSAGVEVVDIRK